jgi:hypothetical protein
VIRRTNRRISRRNAHLCSCDNKNEKPADMIFEFEGKIHCPTCKFTLAVPALLLQSIHVGVKKHAVHSQIEEGNPSNPD